MSSSSDAILTPRRMPTTGAAASAAAEAVAPAAAGAVTPVAPAAARAVARAAVQASQVFQPVRAQPIPGQRGPMVLSTSKFSLDMLAWLRGDSIFAHDGPALRASFADGQAGRVTEAGNKVELGLLPPSSPKINRVNGISLNIPFLRMQIWVRALKHKNSDQFKDIT